MRWAVHLLAPVVFALALPGLTSLPAVSDGAIVAEASPPRLSDFGFFDGAPDRPVAALIPYTLRTPLFSDYADKHRWIYLPPGLQARAQGDGLIDFPVGSALIKNFGYQLPDGSYRTIETRLLLRRASGWVALPYIWRADGSDADLRLAGGRTPVAFTDPSGTPHEISYAVPNRNQCKECHGLAGQVTPIGPKMRNIEVNIEARARFSDANWDLPHLPRWDDPTQPVGARARAYLEVNCAHCHNPEGAASNSGLFLEYERPAGMVTGIRKRAVAAGRGGGGLDNDIEPGAPERSILIYRMRSTDPGIAMPEVGRATVHSEAVTLMEQWIAAMH